MVNQYIFLAAPLVSIPPIPLPLLDVKSITLGISTYSMTGVVATIIATLDGSKTFILTFPGELEMLLPS